MERIRKRIALSAIICFVLVVAIAISFVPQMANAATQIDTSSNYEGYSDYSGNELHNFTKRTNYSGQSPAITVLVHGQGCNAGHWSNNGGSLVYDELSIIEQICYEANANVYVAAVQKVNAECMTTTLYR